LSGVMNAKRSRAKRRILARAATVRVNALTLANELVVDEAYEELERVQRLHLVDGLAETARRVAVSEVAAALRIAERTAEGLVDESVLLVETYTTTLTAHSTASCATPSNPTSL
jgi:protein-disulfide isomerase-like protein with CxxC motif